MCLFFLLFLPKVFVTAGLGGMSGAQAKAAVIAGCIGVVAEVLCITVTQKLQYAFLNWSIHACFSDHLPSNPEVHLGIQFLNPSIYL